ncbi:hypothetical protein B0J13DRAFT_444982 [Dactylonectria estremocensis]|uniref:Rhodopsin domain-containing protein n=1 Tax=Dactylonectria estremocensis TaxID=1079267 RepID=A0A9P9J5E0_9HYPO|nr:hypothetical protein B0J13DRAFT_444982 [Dactylonectria estremocensis]
MENPTLLTLWLFSCLALIIMGTRLVLRKMARQPFNLGDYLTMAACLCCMVRLSLIHVVLIWGTNNIPADVRKTHVFSPDEIYRRTIASKFAITNRCFYNSFLWIQKFVLLDVYRRLLLGLRYERHIMILFLTVLSVTWVAVIVIIFSECHPFHLYWQVVPDPGSCAKAQLELFVVACLNIITDVMLLAFPFLLFTSLQTTWKLKVRLYALFTLGAFIIVITIIRLPINRNNKDSQANRSMWASTELFVATLVVNAPTIYGLWNKKRQDTLHSHSHGTGAASHIREGGTVPHTANHAQAFALASMKHKRDSFGGIMRTSEVILSEYVEHKEYVGGHVRQMDDAEIASSSSQRGILRD